MLKNFLLNVFNSPPPKQGNAEFGPSGQITVLCADFKFKIFTPPENQRRSLAVLSTVVEIVGDRKKFDNIGIFVPRLASFFKILVID